VFQSLSKAGHVVADERDPNSRVDSAGEVMGIETFAGSGLR
jgi:hypothetical protein